MHSKHFELLLVLIGVLFVNEAMAQDGDVERLLSAKSLLPLENRLAAQSLMSP